MVNIVVMWFTKLTTWTQVSDQTGLSSSDTWENSLIHSQITSKFHTSRSQILTPRILVLCRLSEQTNGMLPKHSYVNARFRGVRVQRSQMNSYQMPKNKLERRAAMLFSQSKSQLITSSQRPESLLSSYENKTMAGPTFFFIKQFGICCNAQ